MNKAERRLLTDYRIKSGAFDVFAGYGYSNARISYIAEKADVSNGLVIQNFGSKLELYECLVDECCGFISSMYTFDDCMNLRECLSRLLIYIYDGMRNEKTRRIISFMLTAASGRDTPEYYRETADRVIRNSSIVRMISDEQKEGYVIEGEPSDLMKIFLDTSAMLTEACYEKNLKMPDEEWFIKLIMR